ncbi:hypothetical protein R1sor_000321 [Riccia sorocarpa]|uniref:BTB domain-containing protein n=1 Tax=Riccia sorocarpa TaxID=122646 RepID=A0ABD3GWS1_9MARC
MGTRVSNPCEICSTYKGHFFCRVCAASAESRILTRLRFLREYESSPLSKDFRGDIRFLGWDGEEVHAHKFVMAGRSVVFRRMFSSDMQEKETGIVHCPDASAPVLKSMVNFCYTAEIQFTEEASPEEVLKIAHKYDIKNLKLVCEDELIIRIKEANVYELVMLAQKYDAKQLDKAIAKFFKEGFDVVYPIFVQRLCNDH